MNSKYHLPLKGREGQGKSAHQRGFSNFILYAYINYYISLADTNILIK